MTDKKSFFQKNIETVNYLGLLGIFLFSYLIFHFAYLISDFFNAIMSVASYLAWHNVFEIITSLISIAVFLVVYYTYDQTKNFGYLLLSSFLLCSGLIGIFHTLNFKGMPKFFIENDTANPATTFWIILSLLKGMGFLITCFIPFGKQVKLKKEFFLAGAFIITFAAVIIVEAYPHLLPPMYIEGYGLTAQKIFLEYLVVVLYLLAIGKNLFDYRGKRDTLYVKLSGALIIMIFSQLAFTRYFGVYDVYNYLGHIFGFFSNFLVFRIMFIHTVNKPYFELFKAKNEIKSYANNLDLLVEQRTLELKEMNRKLLEDLDYARDIQRALLPAKLPDLEEVSFEARYFPAERVGGDFYNIFKLDENNIGIYIGDASGHGVSAAMLTVFINQSIKTIREYKSNRVDIIKPSAVLQNIFKQFNAVDFKEEVYMVLFYAVYNYKTRVLTYASAGFNVPPLIRNGNGDISELYLKGFPIIKFFDYEVNYKEMVVQLKSGDCLLLYTDGLIEAENENQDMYTQDKLVQLIKEHSNESGKELADIISRSVFKHIGDHKPNDDITFITINVK